MNIPVPCNDAVQQFAESLLQGSQGIAAIELPLEPQLAHELIECLKKQVDHYRFVDPHQSIRISEMMVIISQQQADPYCLGLSLMAQADSKAVLGELEPAWDQLDEAAEYFMQAGYEVGWARTRIGRLNLCVNLGKSEQALKDADQAREILQTPQEPDYLIRIETAIGRVFNLLGRHTEALDQYETIDRLLNNFPEFEEYNRALLHLQLASTHGTIGNIKLSADEYDLASSIAESYGQESTSTWAQIGLAQLDQKQGKYRQALRRFQQIQETPNLDSLPLHSIYLHIGIIECYSDLNRFTEVIQIARKIYKLGELQKHQYELGVVNYRVGAAWLYSHRPQAAQKYLEASIQCFSKINNMDEMALAQYWLSKSFFLQEAITESLQLLEKSITSFEITQRRRELNFALLLKVEILTYQGKYDTAEKILHNVISNVNPIVNPLVYYQSLVIKAQILEGRELYPLAIQQYRLAISILETMQRNLTVTIHNDFLRDKHDSFHALIRLYLQADRIGNAYQTLEQARSFTYWRYANTQNWSELKIIEHTAFQKLREKHYWLYQQAFGTSIATSGLSIGERKIARERANELETQMSRLIEHVMLDYQVSQIDLESTWSVKGLQEKLETNETLVQYYFDNTSWYVFIVQSNNLAIQALQVDPLRIETLVNKIRFNIECAVQFHYMSPVVNQLREEVLTYLIELYRYLLKPIQGQLQYTERVWVVPYGILHQLPFSLLHDGSRFVIEDFELVNLPTPAVLLQSYPQPSNTGATIMGHSADNRLPNCVEEAKMVHEMIGGDLFLENAATSDQLDAPPKQILHIAAHGSFREDRPEFSHILLGDGQLFTEDLLLYDTRYSLIVLSACETGRGKIAGIDELVGLGRSLLYRGASALLLTLWQIEDKSTHLILHDFYQNLLLGQSKALALQNAQMSVMEQYPNWHPAYWGAFQFIGDPRPIF